MENQIDPNKNDTPTVSPQSNSQPLNNAVQQPTVASGQTISSSTPKGKSKKRFWVLFAFMVVVLVAGFLSIKYFSGSKLIDVSNSPKDDNKISQDLATIGNALANYTGPNGEFSSPFLPSNLRQLSLTKLNYSVGSYSYKVIKDVGGEKDRTEIYQICTNFNTNTFNVSNYNNIFGSSGVDGASTDSYSVHSSGNQCFTNDLSLIGSGLSLDLNNNEDQYKSQLQTN